MIPNGWIENLHLGTSLGTSIIYRCNKNMKRIGASSATCEKSGRWSYNPPQCLCKFYLTVDLNFYISLKFCLDKIVKFEWLVKKRLASCRWWNAESSATFQPDRWWPTVRTWPSNASTCTSRPTDWPPSPVITGLGTSFLDANPVRQPLTDDILKN